MPNPKRPAAKAKKFNQRNLPRHQDMAQDMSIDTMISLMEKLTDPDEDSIKEFLSPLTHPDGEFVTAEGNLDKWIDPRIFRETQVQRFLSWLSAKPPLFKLFFTWIFIKVMGMELAYFEKAEDKNPNKIYKEGAEHAVTPGDGGNFTIHNLGHATELIQTSGMNILTDPVFGNLAPLVYPSMPQQFGRDIQPEDIPTPDVILISHNHRDHVDTASLKRMIAKAKREAHDRQEDVRIPVVLVPSGDESLFLGLGFTDVRGFEWHEQVTLRSKTGEPVTFCGVPADHRSGKNTYDHHQSLVLGWVISPKNREEILYFAGDTAKINDVRMKSLALDIYQLYQHKKLLGNDELPKIINMEPGGRNYTRRDMEPTHQSAVDSMAFAFRLAIALAKVSETHKNEARKITAERWLDATATIFIHQNRFELGPDRFNENVFIFNRLLSYLKMSDAILAVHKENQRTKSLDWSLFHRRKDFIIEGVEELRSLARKIWPNDSYKVQNQKIIEFVQSRTHFPLINEKLNSDDAYQFPPGKLSTIVPPTFTQNV